VHRHAVSISSWQYSSSSTWGDSTAGFASDFAIRVGEGGVTGERDSLMLLTCSYLMLTGEGHLNGVFSDGSVAALYFVSMVGFASDFAIRVGEGGVIGDPDSLML